MQTHAHTHTHSHAHATPPIPFADRKIGTMQSTPGSRMVSPPGMGSVRTHRRSGQRSRSRARDCEDAEKWRAANPNPDQATSGPSGPSNPPGPNPNANSNPPYDNSALTQPTHPTNNGCG